MRIGIYTPYLDSLTGGEKYILTLAICLAKKHNVYIFWDLNFEKKIRQEAKKKLDLDLSSVSFLENIFSKNTSFLSRFFATRNFDYIIVLSDGSIPIVASKLIIHFQFPVQWVNTSSLFTQIRIKRVKYIICNSLFTKSYIDKKFNVNNIVIYPPVSTEKILIMNKENIILHVGRFGIDNEGSNYKKQDVMIDTFKKMIKQGLKNWRFILVISFKDQDKERLNSLKARAKSFPIEILENPNNKKLWELYNKARIYWHASGFGENLIDHPEYAEHFGISTVEAMSAGAVPIVINAGGQKEIVEDDKNGFLWDTLEDLQKKTLSIINDSNLWQNLSDNAKQRAKFFNESRFCQELGKIIE